MAAVEDDVDYKVSSELYEERDYQSSSKPMINKTHCVSRFKFKMPPPKPEQDQDGDLIVGRKKDCFSTVEIEHSKSTVLSLVGLQIWRGALLLADFLMHHQSTLVPEDQFILELGSGVGLSSIIASRHNPVFCTDLKRGGLLKLIKGNILRNKHLCKHPIEVLELDFTSQVLPKQIVDNLNRIPVVIAADVIYDDVITEAFVRTINHLLSKPGQRTVYVALEKRYVFTLADCDSVAPCYEYYVECLHKLDSANIKMELVPLDFPQYFQYDRVKELVLWKISSALT